MNKPWMPVVAGILDIVSGAMGVMMGLFMALARHAARAAQAAPGAAQGAAPRVAPHLGATGVPADAAFLLPRYGTGYGHCPGSHRRAGYSRRYLRPEN